MSGKTPFSEMTLYHYWRSSCSWRVRWALELKGIQPKMVHVGLLDGEVDGESHRSRNPMGHVPVLKVGNSHLIESVAIIEWLEETMPSPSLLPGDSFQRAQTRALMEIVNSGIQPLQNLGVLDQVSADPERRKLWSQHFIEIGLAAFEKKVSETAGRFCMGSKITAADLFLIPQCYNALRNDVNLSRFPRIQGIYQEATATEACKASAPERYQPK